MHLSLSLSFQFEFRLKNIVRLSTSYVDNVITHLVVNKKKHSLFAGELCFLAVSQANVFVCKKHNKICLPTSCVTVLST